MTAVCAFGKSVVDLLRRVIRLCIALLSITGLRICVLRCVILRGRCVCCKLTAAACAEFGTVSVLVSAIGTEHSFFLLMDNIIMHTK